MEMLKSSIDDGLSVELFLHFSGNELRQRNHKKIRSARKGNDRCDCHKHAHLLKVIQSVRLLRNLPEAGARFTAQLFPRESCPGIAVL